MSMKSPLHRVWKWLGPGLITGAADNDPSGIATYSMVGARWGAAPLWLLLYMMPFLIAIQRMCARIGALTGCGLAGNIRRHYPTWILIPVAGLLIVANTFNIGADLYGMAGAIQLLLPIPIWMLVIGTSVSVMLIVVFLRYRQIETIFRWFALSLLMYGVALVVTRPDWLGLLKATLIPSFYPSHDYWLMLFAVLGTTVSPYLFFWQASQEAEDLRQDRPRLKVCKFHTATPGTLEDIDQETTTGMIASNIVSFFIISLAAATLWGSNASNITTLREAAEALIPLAGHWAFLLFTLGLVGSGLLAIPVP
jgi:NRAMP (natural resistance-associated macrophage protein)-like metal ion transporter